MNVWAEEPHWPILINPEEDEIFTSWVTRIAHAFGLKPTFFTDSVLPNIHFWDRDIDAFIDSKLIELFSIKARLPFSFVFSTTLHEFEGQVFESLHTNTLSPWILPTGVTNRRRVDPGLQFCPKCLEADRKPYFRKSWRLATSFICTEHNSYLLDRCPECYFPIAYFKNDPRQKAIHICHNCEFNLQKAPFISCRNQHILHAQNKINKIISDGYYCLTPEQQIHPILFFEGIRHIVRALNRKISLEEINISELDGFDIKPFSFQRKQLEYWAVNQRASILSLAIWLLDDWPDRFLSFCRKNKLRFSDLAKDSLCYPYWYISTLEESLKCHQECLSKEEIYSLIDYSSKAIQSKAQLPLNSHMKEILRAFNMRLPKRLRQPPMIFEENIQKLVSGCIASWVNRNINSRKSDKSINRDLSAIYGALHFTKSPPWSWNQADLNDWIAHLRNKKLLKESTIKLYTNLFYDFHNYLVKRHTLKSLFRALGFSPIPLKRDDAKKISITNSRCSRNTIKKRPSTKVKPSTTHKLPDIDSLHAVKNTRPHVVCDCCGRSMPKASRIYDGLAYCSACYARIFRTVKCEICGKNMRTPYGKKPAICKKCKTIDRTCIRCGRKVPSAGMLTNKGAVCPSCAPYFWPIKRCPKCGKLTRRLTRNKNKGILIPLCDSCIRRTT